MNERHVDELEAEARYRRERLALYRAKTYGAALTSPGRLRKLEQASEQADQRLRAVREAASPDHDHSADPLREGAR